jgi:hypothetical protein
LGWFLDPVRDRSWPISCEHIPDCIRPDIWRNIAIHIASHQWLIRQVYGFIMHLKLHHPYSMALAAIFPARFVKPLRWISLPTIAEDGSVTELLPANVETHKEAPNAPLRRCASEQELFWWPFFLSYLKVGHLSSIGSVLLTNRFWWWNYAIDYSTGNGSVFRTLALSTASTLGCI